MVTSPLAYTLHWPAELPRSKSRGRSPLKVSLSRAVADLQDSLRLFGTDTGLPIRHVVISSSGAAVRSGCRRLFRVGPGPTLRRRRPLPQARGQRPGDPLRPRGTDRRPDLPGGLRRRARRQPLQGRPRGPGLQGHGIGDGARRRPGLHRFGPRGLRRRPVLARHRHLDLRQECRAARGGRPPLEGLRHRDGDAARGAGAGDRAWLGTPYRDQASLRGVGCDCLGLARGVWREVVGPEPIAIPPYSRDWGEVGAREALAEGAGRPLRPAPVAAIEPGLLLIFRMRARAVAKHLGIATECGTFIHAYARVGVIEEPLTDAWRRRVAFAFRFPTREV